VVSSWNSEVVVVVQAMHRIYEGNRFTKDLSDGDTLLPRIVDGAPHDHIGVVIAFLEDLCDRLKIVTSLKINCLVTVGGIVDVEI